MATDLTMTERAARRIGEILKSEPSGAMLRLSVLGGGCSGFQYKFDVERDKADDDVTIDRDGITLLVDSVSLQYLAGSEIDFVDDLIGASFKVNNPKAKASCGCGTSFSLWQSCASGQIRAMPASATIFVHFSMSEATRARKPSGVVGRASPPILRQRARWFPAPARIATISALSRAIIGCGMPAGPPRPSHDVTA